MFDKQAELDYCIERLKMKGIAVEVVNWPEILSIRCYVNQQPFIFNSYDEVFIFLRGMRHGWNECHYLWNKEINKQISREE